MILLAVMATVSTSSGLSCAAIMSALTNSGEGLIEDKNLPAMVELN